MCSPWASDNARLIKEAEALVPTMAWTLFSLIATLVM